MIRFGVFEADLQAGELRKQGVRIKLQEQPFQLLLVLVDRAGEVVTRDELQRRLWTVETFVDFDRSLNKAINKLREALEDSAENPRFIETIPKRGYRFIAPVETTTGRTESVSPRRPLPPVRGPPSPYVRSSRGQVSRCYWWQSFFSLFSVSGMP